MVSEKFQNAAGLIFILFCFILSVLEVLGAFIVFAAEICQIVEIMEIPFFKTNQKDVFNSSIIFLVASGILCISIILGWAFKFSKAVSVIRNVANLFFTAAAIYHLLVMRESNQDRVYDDVIANWNIGDYGIEFQDKYNCHGIENCRRKIGEGFDRVFSLGRGLKAPIAVFWASIIFYGTFSILIIFFAKIAFARQNG